MSSIYYMLSSDSPIGFLHKNKSDILHYFHSGNPIKYILLSPDGDIEEYILGPEIEAGHSFQLLVKGGWWKASEMLGEQDSTIDYALLSEAVTPAFVYEDMEIASKQTLLDQYRNISEKLEKYIKAGEK